MRGMGKGFVYVLESDTDPHRHCTGVTSDIGNRLEWHKHGPCGQTAHQRPWSPASVWSLRVTKAA
jgi:predicted GIY-YIG superfamily endonuclease